jgi:hypothetical protein
MRALKGIAAVVATLAALVTGGVAAMGIGSITHPAAAGTPPASSACTQDTLRIGYDVEYSATLRGYAVTDVTVSDPATAPALASCAGQAYRVTLLSTGGATLGTLTGTVPAGATSFSPAAGLTTPVDAAAVATASLAIGG